MSRKSTKSIMAAILSGILFLQSFSGAYAEGIITDQIIEQTETVPVLTTEPIPEPTLPPELSEGIIPIEKLTATAGSEEKELSTTEGPAEFALDGKIDTFWHTDWQGNNVSADQLWIQFEIDGDYEVTGLMYLPRVNAGAIGANGVITEYIVQVSNDGATWTDVANGIWENDASLKSAEFEGVRVKYIRLFAKESTTMDGGNYASAAEIRLLGYETVVVPSPSVEVFPTPTEEITPTPTIPEETFVAEGVIDEEYGNIIWTIDQNGHLEIRGTGNATVSSEKLKPWIAYSDYVKTVEVHLSGTTDASNFFAYLYNLTSVDLKDFDTSQVTNMHGMFSGCSKLQSLDLSCLNTEKVMDMSEMFSDCWELRELNLENIDTGCVRDMTRMFNMCERLTELDLSSFDMLNATETSDMLSSVGNVKLIKSPKNCQTEIVLPSAMFLVEGKLTSVLPQNQEKSIEIVLAPAIPEGTFLDKGEYYFPSGGYCVWSLDTEGYLEVTGTGDYINYNYQLASPPWYEYREQVKSAKIALSYIKDATNLFSEFTNLERVDLSEFDATQLTTMTGMFRYCINLQSIDFSGFDAENIVNASNVFDGCNKLREIKIPMNLSVNIPLYGEWKTSDGNKVVSIPQEMPETVTITRSKLPKIIYQDLYKHGGDMIVWSIDKDGHLEVSGTGNFFGDGTERIPWFDYRDIITSAKLSLSDITRLDYMFYECSNLMSVDLSELDTSNVRDMSYMFRGCSSLTELDFSGFDTGNLVRTLGMFGGCRKLEELDVSSFDMKNIEDAEDLFYEFSENFPNLVKIRTPKNLSFKVELPQINSKLYNWYDEENNIVTELPREMSESKLFVVKGNFQYPIQGVKNNITWIIDESGHLIISGTGELHEEDTANSALNTLGDVPWGEYRKLIKTAEINVKGMSDASELFWGCSNLTKIDLTNFDTSSVTNMSYLFGGCSSLTELDVSKFNTGRVRNMGAMFKGCSGLTNLDLNGWNTSNVQIMWEMFEDCVSLEKLDLSNWNTSKVGGMTSMFKNCSSLTELYVSGFDTRNVSLMDEMFYGCSSLTELDLSSFNTSNIEECPFMFKGCKKLQSIYGNFDLSNALSREGMYEGCTKLKNTPTGLPVSGVVSNKKSNITWEISMDEKLTVNGTGDFLSDEEERAPWLVYAYQIKTAEIHLSEATNLSGMFEGCINLSEIDLKGLDTKNVTDMSGMFSGCWRLRKLDVSGFDTSNVTTMGSMFYNCRSLGELDLSSFDTKTVTDMNEMFSGYSASKLDLSSFDLSNVQSMNDFLKGCSRLKEIKVPKHCGYEIELIGAWQDAEKNIYMNLPQNLSESVTISRVYGQIEWSIDDTGHLVVNGVGDFPLHSDGISAEIPWSEHAEQIKTAEVNITGITNLVSLFYGCSNLKSVDLSGLDTRDVERMEYMFKNCSSLENIDVSGFDIGNVGNMDSMFYGCANLKELDLSTWVRTESLMIDEMFSGCAKLKEIDLSGFKKAHMGFTESLFEGCTSLDKIKTLPNWEYTSYLPAENKDDIWYGIDGKEYAKLPKRLPYSITLTKNMLPSTDETARFNYENQSDGTIVITGYSSQSTETPAMFSVIGPALSSRTSARTKGIQKDLLIPAEINGKKVTGIKENAFADCQEIVSVQIPASITNIGASAFANCGKLTDVIVGENIRTIGNRAFENCENLAMIFFEKNIPEIEEDTFENVSAKVYYRVDVSEKVKSLKEKMDSAVEMEAFDKYPVSTTFSDTYINEWYIEYVQDVYDNGLMTGLAGTTKFAPNANVTKAQVAQVLYNMEGKPAVNSQKVFKELKDVYASEWYAAAVAWAYNTGVVTGDVNAKKFFPNADVTREQLALMMFRYARYKEYDITASSNLAGLKNAENTSNWALDGVKWAVGAGLISGVEKNGVKDLQPQSNATRAQLAAILERFCIEYRIVKHSM